MAQEKQKHLGAKGLIVLIALISAFVPLSIDLYLPALPGMSANFGMGAERLNLTLTLFFIFYAIGTLAWGPLSDRHGRKPILIIGLGIYILASVFCALAQDINVLILGRIFQAIGASASGVVATAIVKDVFSGRKREKVLAIVQSMVTIAPAVAPVLGAYLLKIMSWRGVFWVLAGIGIVALVFSLLFVESIEERTSGFLFQSVTRLGTVLQNRSFTFLVILFSLGTISAMAFIASSTFIYQSGFHLSSQVFSFYFALNALGSIIGPMIYLWISRRFKAESLVWLSFLSNAICGLLVCILGNLQPWIFALCILPNTIVGSIVRPASTNLMLEQQKGDTGSVSSLIGCSGMLMGSLGMQLISLPWHNTIIALGILTSCIGFISLLAWPFVKKRIILPVATNLLEIQ